MIKHHIKSYLVEPKYSVDKAGVKHFLSCSCEQFRYVVGRNDASRELSKNLDITAFVDDFYPEKMWAGVPVIRPDEMTSNAVVLNCSSSISPLAVRKKFKRNGHYVISYFDLNNVEPNLCSLPTFVKETREDYRNNTNQWEFLLSNLSDDLSKKVLIDLLKYRLSGDYNYMCDYSVRIHQQYFEDFMEYNSEYFVDAGGYDGDTSEEFIKRYPDFGHIYIFEPSPKNLGAAKQRLSHVALQRKIDFIPYGLSNKPGKLAFNPDLGSSSSVLDVGQFMIDVTTLDEYVNEKVSFIKMDLEGWELKALEGAKRHINENHPKLAIAVYHHPSHFWQIFNFIRNMNSDYDVYLRHYTEGWSETVMYFKPKKKPDFQS